MQVPTVSITALHAYPVKSCAGLPLQRARLTHTGFEHDREWMIVRPDGRFVTQREVPRLALIRPTLDAMTLTLHAPDLEPFSLELAHTGTSVEVTCWRDRCAAIDAGERAAAWLERWLGTAHRLVRFAPTFKRASDRTWTGDAEALNQFSDGFPWLVISQASLDDLNRRLPVPLPMNRFRPNIVLDGLPAYGEDTVAELRAPDIALSPVKPCTRCAITTTDQETAARVDGEPLRTLRSYRFDQELRGVKFGQNVIARKGIGEWLEVGQTLQVQWRVL